MKRTVAANLLAALYFAVAFFASLSLAVKSAVAYVEFKHVSNFEGASGYAVMYQLPLWLVLYLAISIGLYVWLRQRLWLLAAVTVLAVVLAMPAISYIAELAWDLRIPTGPLGRL